MQVSDSYKIAQKIVAEYLAKPPLTLPNTGPTEDYIRPDPNAPLPLWNLWGDAGLITRLHIYSPYHIEKK